jgi:multiple sugar transport system ATP-binding protein
MNNGVVQQVSGPEEVYNNPENVFVAGFIGSPPMNFISGQLVDDGAHFKTPCFVYDMPPEVRPHLGSVPKGQNLTLGVRPEDTAVATAPTACAIEGAVYIGEILGKETLVTAKCGDDQLKANVPTNLRLEIGCPVWLRPAPEGLRLFDGATGRLVFNALKFIPPANGRA